jgi:hypothetical protein
LHVARFLTAITCSALKLTFTHSDIVIPYFRQSQSVLAMPSAHQQDLPSICVIQFTRNSVQTKWTAHKARLFRWSCTKQKELPLTAATETVMPL